MDQTGRTMLQTCGERAFYGFIEHSGSRVVRRYGLSNAIFAEYEDVLNTLVVDSVRRYRQKRCSVILMGELVNRTTI